MSGSASKSRKLSVFDRLGPEEDLTHGSSTSGRHASFAGHKRDRQAKSKHHRQGYEDDEHSEKFSQQSSYKERHGTTYSGSSHHHYHKTSVEGGRSDSSECEDVKKEKHSKSKQHEPRDEYSKEKRAKTSNPDKQPEYSDIIEGLSDAEDANLPGILDDLDEKERDSLKYEKGEIRPNEPSEQIEDIKVSKSSRLVEEDKSPEEVFEDGKRLKAGKEKRRKHKGEKLKGEGSEIDSHERPTLIPETDDQDLPSRTSSRRKLVDNKDNRSSVEGSKKKRPAEDSSGYRERSSRSSKTVMATEFDHGSNRDSGSWKSYPASEGSYKHSEMSSLDRHREDRHTSVRKMKGMYTGEEEYSKRGRDRDKDRPSDATMDYPSRKRKRSYSPEGSYSSSKRQKRGKKDIELYDSFSEEDVEADGGNDTKKERMAKNEVDLDLLFLEEDAECLKNTVNSALDRYKPANVLLNTGVSTGLCGSELYNVVSDIVLTHLSSRDSNGDKYKENDKFLEIFHKGLTGLQVSSELQKYRTTNKLIKDVGTRNKAITAQADLSIRNKLRKTANSQRCFPVPSTELPPNWDSELYATGLELYKMNNNVKKSKVISSHCGSVVYM